MEKKIYVITSGEYSNYQVDAVYSTKELAEDFIQHNGDDYCIEEYDLDKPIIREKKLWKIEIDSDRNEIVCAVVSEYQEPENTCVRNYMNRVTFIVRSETMDKAKKIARERYVAIRTNEYIWRKLRIPHKVKVGEYYVERYERFNVKTNEFTKGI
jgi:DNA polymerase IIIc chi subunit